MNSVRRNFNSIINKLHLSPSLSHSKNPHKQKDEKAAKNNQVSREGYVPLYVGKAQKKKKRYEVPVKYLSHPTIQQLLMRSQHGDLETKIDGPIELTCRTEFFDHILWKLSTCIELMS